jgi:hypothetical protein
VGVVPATRLALTGGSDRGGIVRAGTAEGCHMWIAIGMIAVILLVIGVLLVPARSSGDGPVPLDEEAEVLLGEAPPEPPWWSPADDDDARR